MKFVVVECNETVIVWLAGQIKFVIPLIHSEAPEENSLIKLYEVIWYGEMLKML